MNNLKHKGGKYVDINGDRYLDKPDPNDFIEDYGSLEYSYVVSVYQSGHENQDRTLLGRYGFDKKPSKTSIKWCLLRFKGDTATVNREYFLTF